jgi:hypothetical protein
MWNERVVKHSESTSRYPSSKSYKRLGIQQQWVYVVGSGGMLRDK